MRPFPLTFVADPSVATGSISSKIKCCDQSFVVKCVATLLFYCLSLQNTKKKDMKNSLQSTPLSENTAQLRMKSYGKNSSAESKFQSLNAMTEINYTQVFSKGINVHTPTKELRNESFTESVYATLFCRFIFHNSSFRHI